MPDPQNKLDLESEALKKEIVFSNDKQIIK